MLSADDVGNGAKACPAQIGAMGSNEGIIGLFTVTVTDFERLQVIAGPTKEISSSAKSFPKSAVSLLNRQICAVVFMPEFHVYVRNTQLQVVAGAKELPITTPLITTSMLAGLGKATV
jgi:hypothetical protein